MRTKINDYQSQMFDDKGFLTVATCSQVLHQHAITAITDGADEDDMRDTRVHVISYTGFPAAFSGFEFAENT